jgi:hypothetical protein
MQHYDAGCCVGQLDLQLLHLLATACCTATNPDADANHAVTALSLPCYLAHAAAVAAAPSTAWG